MADAAGLDGSAADAGAVCARASDCDNGAFCDGVERCMPGAAGADARGCVPGASPCEDACDESADRCGECVDADLDGHLPLACGGGDCDDTDGDRFPGNPEICDVANHDEDCDRSTVGPDLDEDGHEDPRCCAMWDDELVCGTDCDNGDPAINPERTEICNGRDDDCNGTADDGFECAAEQSVTGTNVCGHEGMRRCSAACAWLDADYYLAEARSTCDYCSDTGTGLGDEIPFASDSFILGNGWFDDHLYGDAELLPSGASIRVTNAGLGGAAAMRTGIYGPGLRMGYGGIHVLAQVAVSQTGSSPDGGWALSVVRAAPGSQFLGSDASTFGIPEDRSGVGVTWTFAGNDRAELVRLAPGGAAVAIAPSSAVPPGAYFPLVAGAAVVQRLSLTITLDRPDTPADEFAIVARAGDGSGASLGISCSNAPGDPLPCGPPFQVGELVHVIVSGSAIRSDIVLQETSGTMGAICPGT